MKSSSMFFCMAVAPWVAIAIVVSFGPAQSTLGAIQAVATTWMALVTALLFLSGLQAARAERRVLGLFK